MSSKAFPSDDRHPIPLTSAILRDAEAKGKIEIYRDLLRISLERLHAGRELEKVHGVVHPEMTAITRDVVRLTEIVHGHGPSSPKEKIVSRLDELVKEHSAKRVAYALKVSIDQIKEWQREGLPEEMAGTLDDLFGGGG